MRGCIAHSHLDGVSLTRDELEAAWSTRPDARIVGQIARIEYAMERHHARSVEVGSGAVSQKRPPIGARREGTLAGNEGSRSLEVRWRGERLLLCGDAEQDGLAAILALETRSGPLRLLLFPHHGSDTPLLGRLLRSPPEEVWISSGGRPAVACPT